AVETQDDVVFAQPSLFGGTSRDNLGDADTACLAQTVAGDVFVINVFTIDAEKAATVDHERKSVSKFVGRLGRLRRGFLCDSQTSSQKENGQETNHVLGVHFRMSSGRVCAFTRTGEAAVP